MRKLLAVLFFTATFTITAFAGEWKQTDGRYWWQNDDGTYPANTWQWIDGNQDGVAECYYFDQNGYLLTNTTTPDSCTVNAEGCWTVDGVIQTQVSQESSDQAQESQPQETQSQAAPAQAAAGFDFSNDNLTMKYVSHEIGKDLNGNTCVIIYYDYTNKTAEPIPALWATMIRVTQNGDKCSDAFLTDNTNQPFEDYYSVETAPGATTRVAEAFSISDMSDITVEVYQFMHQEDASQTVTLKLQ